MMSPRLLLVGLLGIGAISPALADKQAAIDGCIDGVREAGGPDAAGGGQVLSSDYSEAGTLVMLRDAGGTVWRCLAANDGTVSELSVVDAADDGGGAMAGAGKPPQSQPPPGQPETTIHFPAGASGTSVKGVISGHDYQDYVLGARAGQTMVASIDVDRTNGNGTVYFNILPPGSQAEAIFVGSMSVDGRARTKLPADGNYRIRVYLMGNDKDAGKRVAYTLHVAIR